MTLDLVLATKNRKKLVEIRELLAGLDFSIMSVDDFKNIPEIQEDAETFEGNAKKKAIQIAKITRKLSLADDSGLEIDFLGGKPGVRSARFAGENASDDDRNRKVLDLLKGIPSKDRTARFRCVVAISDGEFIKLVNGVCEGRIGIEPRGNQGFGYDPIFIVPSYNKTFAELGLEIKNQISHRAIALKKAREILIDYLHTKELSKEQGG